ncbi:hypothetical protein SAMN05216226_11474 [Halovenus aranensis]|uniref:Uncharacterized protein n=1 Tax=Halovenus aranensis TaxID=890420 RepID=A0A1G8YHF2_9EURY|nr:DUF5783 family protein [Halovenus aranensis]SDK01490.1 hypothetical protein SAMN05216226_11474 [Halovenus aranensis]
MTDFDPEKFDEKYVHYFEELETAYSNAYDQLHGEYPSNILRAIDRQILAESEPVYEGDGTFRVALPDDTDDRIAAVPAEADKVKAVLEEFVTRIESELRSLFGFA